MEQCKAAKQAKAAVAILNAAASDGEITSKKASEKASQKASQKAKEGTALADTPDPELHAEYQADYETAKFAIGRQEQAQGLCYQDVQFYPNLLSVDAKYA